MANTFSTAAQAVRVKRILKDWGFWGYPVVLDSWDPEGGNQEVYPDAEPPDTIRPYCILVHGGVKYVGESIAILEGRGSPSYILHRMLDDLGIDQGNLGGPPEVQAASAALEAAIRKSLR